MKKQDQTVENMIMQAHYLEVLEIESKIVKNDRQKERDEWSSKDDNDNNASSASSSADGEIDQTKVKSENLSR